MKALIIEDNADECDFLEKGMTQLGYTCETVKDGKLGYSKLVVNKYDIALVDLMLPRLDGRELIAKARAAGIKTHIIIVSLLGSIPDRVNGLEIGADDYMPKPCSMDELRARIQAFNRRLDWSTQHILSAHGIQLDTEFRTCKKNGRSIDLSKKEFSLLQCLMENQGSTVPAEILIEKAWGFSSDQPTNLIAPHISRIRTKLGFSGEYDPIENKRGTGYAFL